MMHPAGKLYREILRGVKNVWGSRSAVLCTEELHTVAKAPRPTVFIKDIEVQELDVYEVIREIEAGGTCTVYVPDVMVLLALESFSGRTDLKFSEVCLPTYLCSDLKRYWELQARAQAERRRRWPHLLFPPGVEDVAEPVKVKACTTIGSPYVAADWDYFLSYPPGLLPNELAALLRKKMLKFLKVLPKIEPIENPVKTHARNMHRVLS